MQTRFSPAQLEDPAMASSERVIRKCVHCGFCTATCPTYVLLGDELDSPRGRIYLIKDMLEGERVPTAETVKHVDRCLSCLSCVTTCPSGVNYRQLVDHARAYIEQRYRRPIADRLLRSCLAWILPHPGRFRAALAMAWLARPLRPVLERFKPLRPIAAMLRLAPERLGPAAALDDSPAGEIKGRVVLLGGCAEPVLRPEYQHAAARLLNRAGYRVGWAPGVGCCGALVHHIGREAAAMAQARRNVDAWTAEIERRGLDAIISTASGCGSAIKDYGSLLGDDPDYAEKAARISALARDVSEFLDTIELPAGDGGGLVVAYQSACSLQHGQKIMEAPKRLLARAGFVVREPAEAHLCCGSAGTYNILQPEIADRLGDRKVANIEKLAPAVIATGNIGCAMQIGQRTEIPVAHVVELVDWATGGPIPPALVSSHHRKKHHADHA